MATVLITGGTGMIGSALGRLLLEREYKVIILSRNPPKHDEKSYHKGFQYATWHPANQTIDRAAVEEADYIVNLAGAAIGDKRWTDERKKELFDSRVQSANTLVKALKEIPNKVRAVVQASGTDWYPKDPVIPNNKPFVESDPNGEHFLGKLCDAWEAAIHPVTQMGKRLVIFRTGLVLSKSGGALDRFERPVRFGIAPILSGGEQIISWIHIEDLCRMYVYALEIDQMLGVYNAVAPTPVSNKTFMLELAVLLTGRFFVPVHVPAFALKMVYGELGASLLKSTTVSCLKISNAGFQFRFPTVESALFDIEKK
jgi:uncharacterized protein (TIGR01777 family)